MDIGGRRRWKNCWMAWGRGGGCHLPRVPQLNSATFPEGALSHPFADDPLYDGAAAGAVNLAWLASSSSTHSPKSRAGTLMDSAFEQLSQEEEIAGDSRRGRRLRTNFSDAQTALLESTFLASHYPDQQLKRDIATHLHISPDRVTVWFQNRRSKWRRANCRSNSVQMMAKGQQQQIIGSANEVQAIGSIDDPTMPTHPYRERRIPVNAIFVSSSSSNHQQQQPQPIQLEQLSINGVHNNNSFKQNQHCQLNTDHPQTQLQSDTFPWADDWLTVGGFEEVQEQQSGQIHWAPNFCC